jgi:diguanylate cyclase (GGDEF)-like protein
VLGAVRGAETWDRLLSVSEPWGLLRFADHRNEAANVEMLSWVPDTAPIDAVDAWHPEDALYAPLTASDGSRLGTLSVDLPHDGRRPSPTTCKALEAFAISAALAIEHAALRGRAEDSERRYRHLAAHDSLTGVGNRSLLLDRLEHALTRRVGAGSLLSVVFIDLDKFKPINDGHSHDAGDHVLKVVASRIKALVRPHDTIARWGGDEFLVLLENLEDEVAALVIAQRIVAVVATPIRRYGEDLSVTASVGVAVTRAGERIGVDELVRRADAGMYVAKRAGGNACAVFPHRRDARARDVHTRPTSGTDKPRTPCGQWHQDRRWRPCRHDSERDQRLGALQFASYSDAELRTTSANPPSDIPTARRR